MMLTFVNVTEYVIFGFNSEMHCGQQFNTAYMISAMYYISVAQRWSMSDQYVRISGYQIPFIEQRLTTFKLKCIATFQILVKE